MKALEHRLGAAQESGNLAAIVGERRGELRSGFTVDIERVFENEFGDTRVIGVLTNGNSVPAGAALKITSFSASGSIVEVRDGTWPASTRNIDPGARYPFETIASSRAGVARVSVEVVDARMW